MRLPYFQLNTFAERLDGGNPAGVCILPEWLPDAQLQAIAAAGMMPETAFVVLNENPIRIRWFTCTTEVDLCGHASIAAGYVLARYYDRAPPFDLHSPSGVLRIEPAPTGVRIGLPLRAPEPARPSDALIEGLGCEPVEVLKATDYLVVLRSEAQVRNLTPNLRRFERLKTRGVIVTAPGTDDDFVTRFFAPALGIDEDHVTGSAFCTLAPYWAERLAKTELRARQLSARGGAVHCSLEGDRVTLHGPIIPFIQGEIEL
jgi:PhzF family phenazine biosynthesis protein